jgi:hypothetical protein
MYFNIKKLVSPHHNFHPTFLSGKNFKMALLILIIEIHVCN